MKELQLNIIKPTVKHGQRKIWIPTSLYVTTATIRNKLNISSQYLSYDQFKQLIIKLFKYGALINYCEYTQEKHGLDVELPHCMQNTAPPG